MYGAYIRAARERVGLTRQQACEKVGMSADGLFKIETDKNEARLSTLEKLAAAYKCMIGDLLPNSGASSADELVQPLMAALAGLDGEQLRDELLVLASQARLYRNEIMRQKWRVDKQDREYNSGSNRTADEPHIVAGLGGAVSGSGATDARDGATTVTRHRAPRTKRENR